ncbi:glycosyltransferase family 25 protein [Limnohabitans sp. TEGF004]|uniref:glycosyltransferase family 25 protein n=1 Tax=Limnohabitans sp. TEGF004 TaxID=2986281 RepID=UPI002377B69E|nr:glycosyltransferase family 25 protein [Limnohabitans sp. TEGF004]BDU54770.1 hypothetical protein LTEGF4_04510 [Limnohabitans sp. TEGF004]
MIGYYINLDRSVERRLQFEGALQRSELEFHIQRFPAINGQEYPVQNKNLSFGQWGCWLSHLSIIEHHVNNVTNDLVLILEDDSCFDKNLNLAHDLIKNYQEDWDIIYLDGTFVEVGDMISINNILHNSAVNIPKIHDIHHETTIYGTHGYILNYKNIKKVHELLKNNIFLGLPIDNILCALVNEKKINAKIILPLIIYPSDENNKSNICNDQHPLINDWITYRHLISLKNIKENGPIDAIEKSKEIGQRRISFDFSKKFLPLRNLQLAPE